MSQGRTHARHNLDDAGHQRLPAPFGSFPTLHKPDWDKLLFHLPAELLLARAGLLAAQHDAHAGGSRRAGQLAALHGSRDFDDAALLPSTRTPWAA